MSTERPRRLHSRSGTKWYIHECAKAHHQSAFRENPSSVVMQMLGRSGRPFDAALSAAIATTCGLHACVPQARRVLRSGHPVEAARTLMLRGERVPGYGASFDISEWDPVRSLLKGHHYDAVLSETEELVGHKANPSVYTAIYAELTDVPLGTEIQIVVMCRLDAWGRIWRHAYDEYIKQGPLPATDDRP